MTGPDQSSAPARPPAEPLGLLRRWLGEAAAVPGGGPPAAVVGTGALATAVLATGDGESDRLWVTRSRWAGLISPCSPRAAAGSSPPPR
jgi:hypothetical protein